VTVQTIQTGRKLDT